MDHDLITLNGPDWEALAPPFFARCVGSDSSKFVISRPFVVGDWLYATDRAICVRCKTPPAWDVPNAEIVPRGAAEVFEAITNRVEATPLCPVDGPCCWCNGVGKMPDHDCRQCGGEGTQDVEDCECPRCCGDHPCGDCNGTGKILAGDCEACEGFGMVSPDGHHEMTPGYWIARKYAKLLIDIGATAYLPAAPMSRRAMYFTFPGGEGVLMPMTPPRSLDD